MSSSLLGLHHVTAIAGDPQRNIDFYTAVLGLRLVKKTVNFDDPGTYHLYYGNETGEPGSILTFFCWPGARRGQNGTGQASVTSFLIPENAIEFWRARLKSSNVHVTEGIKFDERYLSFRDPDGLEMEMVGSPLANSRTFWARGPVAPEFAMRGFRGVTLLEELHEKTAALLTEELGFARLQEDGNRIRYQVGAENSLAVVDVVGLRGEGRGQIAVGSIHHLAWRVRDEYQLEWKEKLTNLGHYLSPVMDRRYFRSIYFREPGGVLFEIATDGPGFVVDEPIEELGRSLSLPPWLESMRGELERRLAPVQIRDFHS